MKQSYTVFLHNMAESYSYIFYIQSFQLLTVLHTYSLFFVLFCLFFHVPCKLAHE